MLVSEIFHSVQGEGQLTGVPSVFVRTSGCNLRCRWCDTKYASWDPQGTQMTNAEIVAKVTRHPADHVVVTGGEPMVASGITDLLTELRSLGKHITIETAGTVPPDHIPCDLASISPKLSNSTPLDGEIDQAWITRHNGTRLDPKTLRTWIDTYHYQLKFVVSSDHDLEEIESLVTSLDRDIPPHKILLMPEGTTPATLKSRQQSLLSHCLKKGYRYCHRLHIDLFGNTPGT
ncbi:MAG: 7-carboxy-7-deazaguanine synthase QueE [Verrucomicrobiales bacterium]|nr:7-carboxy-7-deazaguanine synthase QueE [Verrucomicrobiales bacterium]